MTARVLGARVPPDRRVPDYNLLTEYASTALLLSTRVPYDEARTSNHLPTHSGERIPVHAWRAARTGAQRLRKRVVRAAPVRVPVELAADCVPEAPSGVVRVLITATVHTRARDHRRDGRQTLARLLGLEPKIASWAVVAVCAAIVECCTEFHNPPRGCLWHSAKKRSTGRVAWLCGPCAVRRGIAIPPGGLSVGAVALGPAVAVALEAAALSLQQAATEARAC